MKIGIVILMLFTFRIYPIMASEREGQQPAYIPGDEEVGGTIYGSLSGTSFTEDPNPDPTPQPLPTPNPNPDIIQKPEINEKEQNTTLAGSATGDSSKFFLWGILFIGTYFMLRVYKGKQEE